MDSIELKANHTELRDWRIEHEKISCYKLTLHKGLPAAVGQTFSLALDYCHLAELDAKTDGCPHENFFLYGNLDFWNFVPKSIGSSVGIFEQNFGVFGNFI